MPTIQMPRTFAQQRSGRRQRILTRRRHRFVRRGCHHLLQGRRVHVLAPHEGRHLPHRRLVVRPHLLEEQKQDARVVPRLPPVAEIVQPALGAGGPEAAARPRIERDLVAGEAEHRGEEPPAGDADVALVAEAVDELAAFGESGLGVGEGLVGAVRLEHARLRRPGGQRISKTTSGDAEPWPESAWDAHCLRSRSSEMASAGPWGSSHGMMSIWSSKSGGAPFMRIWWAMCISLRGQWGQGRRQGQRGGQGRGPREKGRGG